MSDESNPFDNTPFPVTDLGAAAVQVHELYMEFVNAGFPEERAFQLICVYISASFGARGGEQ